MRGLTAPTVSELEHASAQEVLSHMLERHHPRLALACSFQKEEAVLIDMLLSIEPSARVFTIDTGVLFPETYQAWRELERRYGVAVEIFDAQRPTDAAWSAGACCSERKVAALWKAIERARDSGDWRPRPSKLCDWCNHKALCPEFGGTPPPLPEMTLPEVTPSEVSLPDQPDRPSLATE